MVYTIEGFVNAIGFKPLKSNPCSYIYEYKNLVHNHSVSTRN